MTNPANNKNTPQLRFPEFSNDAEWEEKTLGNKIDLLSGYPFKSEEILEDSNGIRLLRGINITEGRLRHSQDIDRYFLGDTKKLEKYKVKTHDLVIAMDGSKVGKNTALVTEDESGALLVQRVARLRTQNINTISFIFQHINSKKFHSYVDKINTSSGIPHISSKQIEEFKIYFPQSEKEQQKIADCLSSLDELIAAQGEKVAALKTHKKALMQQLFPTEGETLPKLRFKEFENDGEWEEKSLGEIAELTSSKRIHLSDYVSNGIPFFRGKEISLLKNQEVIDDILYISEEQYNQIREKYGVPQVGDILITAVGTLGNVYCIENNNRFYFKDGNLIWMKNILEISKFLEIQLDFNYKMVFASAIGSSQKALTIAGLNKLKFRIPLKPEQQKIANCLSSIDEQIAAESERLSALKEHKKGLMQGLFPSITDSREGA